MNHSLIRSLTRLSFVFLILAQPLLAKSTEDGGSIKLNATVGKNFAVSLTDYTGVKGTYSIIKGAEWLQITEQGILFGTPTANVMGENEVFLAASVEAKEYLYHVIVTVGQPLAPSKFHFKAKVDNVFKVDLKNLTKVEGTYSYADLPKWVSGLETGILVGMPKQADMGINVAKVSITNEKGVQTFAISFEVKAASSEGPATGQKPLVFTVGQKVKIYVGELSKMAGYHYAALPSWLVFTVDGYIMGTPEVSDIGKHEIRLKVVNATVTYIRIPVLVKE